MKLEERTRDEKLPTPTTSLHKRRYDKQNYALKSVELSKNLLDNIYFLSLKPSFLNNRQVQHQSRKRIYCDIRETRSSFTLQSNIALFGPGFALAIDLPTFTSWSSNRFRSVKGCEFGLQIIRYRSILYTLESKLVILSIDYLNDFKISIDQK